MLPQVIIYVTMSNIKITNGKLIKVSAEVHERIFFLSQTLRKNTGLRHPADVVVRMAIGLLEDRLNIVWPPLDGTMEDSDAER